MDPSSQRPAPPPHHEGGRRWYGWQTLLVDLLGGAWVVRFSVGPSGPTVWIGLAALLLGGPFVHLVNGSRRGAARSVSLRLLLSIVFPVVWNGLSRHRGYGFDALGDLILGWFVGIAAACIADAAMAFTGGPSAPDAGPSAPNAEPPRFQPKLLIWALVLAVVLYAAMRALLAH